MNYTDRLYRILKPLALRDPPVKLYRNTRQTDYDSQNEDYVVFSTGISNRPRLFGDGVVLLRRCSCDITVVERGTGNNENAGYLVDLVENLLKENNIHYNRINVGYEESTDSIQTTFDFYLI